MVVFAGSTMLRIQSLEKVQKRSTKWISSDWKSNYKELLLRKRDNLPKNNLPKIDPGRIIFGKLYLTFAKFVPYSVFALAKRLN